MQAFEKAKTTTEIFNARCLVYQLEREQDDLKIEAENLKILGNMENMKGRGHEVIVGKTNTIPGLVHNPKIKVRKQYYEENLEPSARQGGYPPNPSFVWPCQYDKKRFKSF